MSKIYPCIMQVYYVSEDIEEQDDHLLIVRLESNTDTLHDLWDDVWLAEGCYVKKMIYRIRLLSISTLVTIIHNCTVLFKNDLEKNNIIY